MTDHNKNKNNFLSVLFILAITALLVSCTDFFSSSLASWAARDPANLIPDVTIDNVNELIEIAQNDPDLSLELLIKIEEAAEGASGGEKAELQAAAVDAAANAVGLGQTILNSAGELAGIEDAESAKDAILGAIDSMPNLEDACAALYELLPKDPSGEEFENFINTATPDDIALAAILLLAGEAKKNAEDIEGYVNTFDADSGPEAKLALNLAAALADKEEELSETLFDILESLNLI